LCLAPPLINVTHGSGVFRVNVNEILLGRADIEPWPFINAASPRCHFSTYIDNDITLLQLSDNSFEHPV
jgi:hypothetical protein